MLMHLKNGLFYKNYPTRLYYKHDFRITRYKIDFYIKKICNMEFFSYVKLNHGFWQGLIKGDPWEKEVQRVLHGDSMIKKVLDELEKFPANDPSSLLAVSHLSSSYDNLGIKKCWANHSTVVDRIATHVPKGLECHFGPLWKMYCYDGQIVKLVKVLREFNVVIIGLSHLESVGKRLGLPQYNFIRCRLNLTRYIDNFVDSIIRFHQNVRSPTIYLFQVGETNGFYLIRSLQKQIKDAWLIDLGRTLDIFCDAGVINEFDDRLISRISRWSIRSHMPDLKKEMWILDWEEEIKNNTLSPLQLGDK